MSKNLKLTKNLELLSIQENNAQGEELLAVCLFFTFFGEDGLAYVSMNRVNEEFPSFGMIEMDEGDLFESFTDQLDENWDKIAAAIKEFAEEWKQEQSENVIDIDATRTKQLAMESIFDDIRAERERQEAKWGQQNHSILDPTLIDRGPSRMCEEYEIPTEIRAKQMVEIHAQRGDLTYMHILIEEISEAASCGSDIPSLRRELIQSASVLIAMIESLDRNGK